MTISSKTVLNTERASRYLQQLCKHFSHKLDVKFTPVNGHIKLPMGNCRLATYESFELLIAVEVADTKRLEKTKQVITDHLLRFAFREDLSIDWTDQDPSNG